jgi:hypothetical protein
MWRVLQAILWRLQGRQERRRIEHILRRIGRGQARRDGLRLDKVSHRLEIQWRARDIHAWDRDLPFERRASTFVEQTLADTEAVIAGLFESLPQVDVIDLAVLEPESDRTMMAGTVCRSSATNHRRLLSIKMRLSELGVQYRLVGSRFEALDPDLQSRVQSANADAAR